MILSGAAGSSDRSGIDVLRMHVEPLKTRVVKTPRQAAHLQQMAGAQLGADELKEARADLVRRIDFKLQAAGFLLVDTSPSGSRYYLHKTEPTRVRVADHEPNEATWGKKDGVYSYRKDIAKRGDQLPKDAKVVFFHGKQDPWRPPASNLPWVKHHYVNAVSALS